MPYFLLRITFTVDVRIWILYSILRIVQMVCTRSCFFVILQRLIPGNTSGLLHNRIVRTYDVINCTNYCHKHITYSEFLKIRIYGSNCNAVALTISSIYVLPEWSAPTHKHEHKLFRRSPSQQNDCTCLQKALFIFCYFPTWASKQRSKENNWFLRWSTQR